MEYEWENWLKYCHCSNAYMFLSGQAYCRIRRKLAHENKYRNCGDKVEGNIHVVSKLSELKKMRGFFGDTDIHEKGQVKPIIIKVGKIEVEKMPKPMPASKSKAKTLKKSKNQMSMF